MDGKIKLLKILVVIFFIIIYFFSKNSFFIIFLSWSINIIIIKNVQLFQSQKYKIIFSFIRRTLYLLPLAIPIIFLKNSLNFCKVRTSYSHLIVGILIGIIFLIPHLKKYMLYFNKEFIELLEKKKKYYVVANSYSLICGAVLEEIYFRKIIISLTQESLGFLSIIFSTLLFFFHHYSTNKISKFTNLDFLNQIIFGLVAGGFYFYYQDIIITIIAHIIYNLPLVILDLKLLEKRSICDK